jgi:hypothetical protein
VSSTSSGPLCEEVRKSTACPPRVGAAYDQMGDALSKRVRLAGPRAGDDQEGSSDKAIGGEAVLDGSRLLWIERFEI